MPDTLINSIEIYVEPFVPNALPPNPHNKELNKDKKITNKYIFYLYVKKNYIKINGKNDKKFIKLLTKCT